MKKTKLLRRIVALILVITMIPISGFVNARAVSDIRTDSGLKTMSNNNNTDNINAPFGTVDITLSKDMVMDDEVCVNADIDLNGHTLEIKNNLIQENGEIKINGGKLIIDGDYRIQKIETNSENDNEEVSYGISQGRFVMNNPDDLIDVNGNLYIDTRIDTEGFITEGNIRVSGNIEIENNGINKGYYPTGNHTLILDGTEKQIVKINESYDYSSHINNLIIENIDTYLEDVFVCGHVNDNENKVYGGIKITSDTSFENNKYHGNITDCSGNIEELEIYGDFSTYNYLAVDKKLIINGDLHFNDCMFCVNDNAYVEVNGDFYHGSETSSHIQNLNLSGKNSLLKINGNYFYIHGQGITGGRIELAKDFINYGSFFASDNTFILNGNEKQSITADKDDRFDILELRNTSEEGVVVENELVAKNLIRNNSKLTYNNGNEYFGTILSEDIVIDGDYTLDTNELDLNGHSLTINGNFNQNTGTLIINNGCLNVKGNYNIDSSSVLVMNYKNDEICVDGNFNYNPDYKHNLQSGNINVKGNIYLNNSFENKESYALYGVNLVLSGEKEQKITIENDVILRNLVINNATGLVVEGFIDFKNITGLFGTQVEYNGKPLISGGKLNEDKVIDGDCDGIFGNIDFNGYSLTINGNLNISYGKLNIDNGTINLKGNLKSNNNISFNGDSKLIFNGDKLQRINVKDEDIFRIVEIDNIYGVYSNIYFPRKELIVKSGKITYGNEELIQNISKNYEIISGITLDSDKTYDGDVYLTDGTLDLNGHTLTVKGDLVQSLGTININKGNLIIDGNYISSQITEYNYSDIEDKESYEFSSGNGIIKMNSGKISISGDFIYDSNFNKDNYITGGDIEVNGNLEINKELVMKDTNLYLKGENQKISGNYPLSVKDLHLNKNKFSLLNSIDIYGKIVGNPDDVEGSGRIYISDINNLNDAEYDKTVYIMNGNKLNNNIFFLGDIVLSGGTDLNGYTLSCKNITVRNNLNINGGKLTVEGNLTVDAYGRLIMNTPEDYILVVNDFTMESYNNHSDLMVNGTLEIKGNLYQKSYRHNNNFLTDGDCKVVLSRNRNKEDYRQLINFENPDNAKIKTLVLRGLESDYIFKNDINEIAENVIYDPEDNTPPEKVKNIVISNITETGTYITFDEGKDESGILGYEIYRDGERIAFVTDTFFNDLMLMPDTTYEYEVYALDSFENKSLESDIKTVTTKKDIESPTINSKPFIKKVSGSSATIGYEKADDNTYLKSYKIYRKAYNGDENSASFEEIKTLDGDTLEFKDTNLEKTKIYKYKIKAIDVCGNESEYSEELTVTMNPPKILSYEPSENTEVGNDNIHFLVTCNNNGNVKEKTLTIEYIKMSDDINLLDEDNWKQIAFITDTDKFDSEKIYYEYNYSIENIKESEELLIKYTFTDEDGCKDEKISRLFIDRLGPDKVTRVEAVDVNGCIKITYNLSANADCKGYRIYRKSENESGFSLINSVNNKYISSFTDKNVVENSIYTYYVTAIDKFDNESIPSDEVMVETLKDEENPTIKSLEPAKEKIGKTCEITVEAKDNKKVSKVRLEYAKINDENEDTHLEYELIDEVEAIDDNIVYELDTTSITNKYGDGIYKIKAVAIDSSGNESIKEFTRRYEIDTTGIEKIKIDKVNEKSSSVYLSWEDISAEDLNYFEVEYRKSGEENFKSYEKIKDYLGVNITDLESDTAYEIRVSGVDNLGNRGEYSDLVCVTTKEDNIAPKIRKINPGSGEYKDIINLSMDASDEECLGKGIISYSLDGINYEELETILSATYSSDDKIKAGVYNAALQLTDIPEGEIYVKFEVYDDAGNKNQKTSDENDVITKYTVDKTNPLKPENICGINGNGYIEITWNKDDDVKSYNIYRKSDTENTFKPVKTGYEYVNYYDTDIIIGKRYTYKIEAIDPAGNISPESDEVIVCALNDYEKPVIQGISPKDNEYLGGSLNTIKIIATDNARVDSINVMIKKDSTDLYTELVSDDEDTDEENADNRIKLFTKDISKLGLSDGIYVIKVNATDKYGNISDTREVPFIYSTKKPDKPIISTVSLNYEIGINISGINDDTNVLDIEKIELFRRKTGSLDEFKKIADLKESLYKDSDVEVLENYDYKVRITNLSGNYSESNVVSGYALDVDTINPKANLPEMIQGFAGEEICFDGTLSSDNVRITEYAWNFGDGYSGTKAKQIHTYEKAGEYILTLAVKDGAGNVDYTTSLVTVKERENNGEGLITVLDDNGNGIAYADICLLQNDGSCINLKADAEGKCKIFEQVGIYKVAAFSTGYMPKDEEIEIRTGDVSSLVISLSKGELIEGNLTARRMTLQEMMDNGVDLYDPANYNHFSYKVELTFSLKPIPVEVIVLGNETKIIEPEGEGSPSKGGEEIIVGGLSNYIENEGGNVPVEEEEPIIMVLRTLETVSWLKDMYTVDLSILNNADNGYVIKNSEAKINLVNGISLANTKNNIKETIDMGEIYGGQKKTASWVVRGDKSGTYSVSADFNGTLMPFNRKVSGHFKTEKSFDVATGEGLHITIKPENAAFMYEDYYIQYEIANESDRIFYGISKTFGKLQIPESKPLYVYDTSDIDKYQEAVEEAEKENKKSKKDSALDPDKIKTGNPDNKEKEITYDLPRSKNTDKDSDESEKDNKDENKSSDNSSTSTPSGNSGTSASSGNSGTSISSGNADSVINNTNDHVVSFSGTSSGLNVPKPVFGMSKELMIKNASSFSMIPVVKDGDTIKIASLVPGQTVYGTWKRKIDGRDGYDPKKYYYDLIEYTAESLRQDDMGVKLTIQPVPSHMSITIIKYTLKDMPDFAGDPIDLSSGAFVDSKSLIKFNGGNNISFDLSYDSRNSKTKTSLGYGWFTPYETTIEDKGGYITYNTGNGCSVNFMKEGFKYDIVKGSIVSETDDKVTIAIDSSDELTYGKYLCCNDTMDDYEIVKNKDNTYELKTPGGSIFKYNAEGKLTGITDEEDKSVSIVYEDNRTTIKDMVTSKEIHFEKNDRNLITKIYDDNGRNAYIAYNNDVLTSITDENGNITRYTYEKVTDGEIQELKENTNVLIDEKDISMYLITKEEDINGRAYVTNKYDDKGRVTYQVMGDERYENTNTLSLNYEETNEGITETVTDSEGNTEEIKINHKEQIYEQTDANGKKTEFVYDENGNVIATKISGSENTDGSDITDLKTATTVYDENGNVLSYKDYMGNKISYEYDDNGNVSLMRDAKGNESDFEYDEKGRLLYLKTYGGEEKTYEYDANGFLIKQTTAGLGSTLYSYKNGMMNSVTDDKGVTYLDYDGALNVISVTDKLGNITKYTYDNLGNKLTEEKSDGGIISYEYDHNSNITKVIDELGNVTTYNYDSQGRIIEKITPDGGKTTYEYNSLGYNDVIDLADNTKNILTYDAGGNVVKNELKTSDESSDTDTLYEESAEYNLYGLVSKTTDNNGNITTYSYNKNGNIEEIVYDNRKINYTYDSLNNVTKKLITITKEDGSIAKKGTNISYDSMGNVVSKSYFEIDEKGEEKTILSTSSQYDIHNRKISDTDANGNKTSYEYDNLGEVTSLTYPDGTKVNMTYDSMGRMIESYTYVNGEKFNKVYEYDSVGRIIKQTDEEGNSESYTYDLKGNVLSVADANGTISESYTYDEMDRIKECTDTLGNVSTINYDISGRVINSSTKYLNGIVKENTYAYDSFGNLITSNEYGGNTVNASYNEKGLLSSITDANGGTYKYEYDSYGRVIKEINPIGGIIKNTYDEEGNISIKENEAGEKTYYTYDSLGRIICQNDNLGTISYTYDNNNNLLTTTDENGTISRSYDEMNRVTEYTDFKGNTVKYGYDELGNLITLTYPGGEIIRYDYYKNGLLKSVTDFNNNKTSYEYDGNGRLTKTIRSDGSYEENIYDNAYRLTEKTDRKADGKIINHLKYEYDAYGNIIKIDDLKEDINSDDKDFENLNLNTDIESAVQNRLKNSSESEQQTDSVMLVSSENMTYDSDNRLTSYNGKEVIYDEKGNMTYGPSSLITDTDKAEFYEYTYDCRNRLIKAGNEKDGYTEYSYDAENNRIELKTKDYTKDYVVESASSEYSRVLSETITYTKDKTKNNIKYVYGNGLISEYNGNLIANYHFNHLGSTIALTDKDGKVTNRYEYGVYGNLTAKNSDNKEFLYNGEYGVITDENNLYYMRSRYYNPVIKRFINRDIVAGEMTNSKSLNRFAYVQGNPVSYTDPFGLSPSGNSHSFKNLIHSVLDVLGMIPGIGEIFDLANAAMYLVEGNYKMAGLSLLGALPLIGNMVSGIKFATNCVKLTKAANVISKTLKYASIIGGIAVAGYTAFTAGKDIYQGVKNHDLTLGRVIADVLSIGISAAGIGFGLKELGSNIKDDFGIDLKENFKEFLADNRGFVDLDATIGGSKGGSNQKYYHVTSKENAYKLANSDNPVLEGKEFKQVYAWTEQPTLKQSQNSGARYLETVIEFETNETFLIDTSIEDRTLWNIARISNRPGPISISNVKIVGFKEQKKWWEFWKI